VTIDSIPYEADKLFYLNVNYDLTHPWWRLRLIFLQRKRC